MGQELNYVRHHIQKISAFFLAMRNFRDEKCLEGHTFHYIALDDPENTQNLSSNIKYWIQKGPYSSFEYLLPDEYRLDGELKKLCQELESEFHIPCKNYDTEHFFTDRDFLKYRLRGKKTYLMETFYRELRVMENVLMSGELPEGGVWNLDKENRKPYDFKTPIPKAIQFSHNGTSIKNLLDNLGYSYMGNLEKNFLPWPISRKEALVALDYFVEYLLPNFGKFEDAMVDSEPNLFHSRLSFSMNLKLISPREVIDSCLIAYKTHPEKYDLASLEGFIRQILGWREFMRGQYWAKMPDFSNLNFFSHTRDLPSWYWNGDTKMNCLQRSIQDSLNHGYAHHIQRLMITGNFALLAGINPDQIDLWYLGIYIDAIEWVEITNTRGMSQFADGGLIASKPYVSGANYISKMSNYCKGCIYNPKIRYGKSACPFNSFYWNFFLSHQDLLRKNIRLALVYKILEKMEPDEVEKIQNQAHQYLSEIETL
jgi:deoxyribodipyrimidine photolyase-related protein